MCIDYLKERFTTTTVGNAIMKSHLSMNSFIYQLNSCITQ